MRRGYTHAWSYARQVVRGGRGRLRTAQTSTLALSRAAPPVPQAAAARLGWRSLRATPLASGRQDSATERDRNRPPDGGAGPPREAQRQDWVSLTQPHLAPVPDCTEKFDE